MNKMEKKIPLKNYVLVGIISICTVMLLGYFTFWYKNNQEYYDNNSIMSGYLSEIREAGVVDNLTNYMVDNPNNILYVSYGNDSSIKEFEKEFKELITKHNISSEFIYIDLNLVSDKKLMLNIKEKFFSDELNNKNIDLKKQSNLFVFENGKIVDLLYNSKRQINIADVRRFLVKNGVINND